MWQWIRIAMAGLVLFAISVVVLNGSWHAPAPADPQRRLLSHRGVHQTFDRTNIANDTCTAERIFPPTHDLMENTLPSIKAAFDAGADVVEIDIAATTDGQMAVFHDWSLGCRTDGKGPIRDHSMEELRALDLGYGYTVDRGRTFPLRGKGIGLMPTLSEVFAAFPQGRFLINYKSRDAYEGILLAALIEANPDVRRALWSAYGGTEPTERANELIPGLRGFTSTGTRYCLIGYVLLGWSGHIPVECRNTHVMVPINYTWAMWGWPDLFHQRMAAAGSDIILIGPVEAGETGTSGIDTPELLKTIPDTFDGYIWTNRIELIGPLVTSEVL